MKGSNILGIPAVFKDRKNKRKVRILFLGTLFFAGFFLWTIDPVNLNWRPMFKNDPATLRIFAPSIVVEGESIDFTVECWDYCERLSSGYDGTIKLSAVREKPGTDGDLVSVNADFSRDKYKFSASWLSQGFFEAYRFPWGDGGMKELSVKFNEPGIHYIIVEDVQAGMKAYSNPVVVFEEEPELYLYWGDIHGHTSKCDGSGDLETVLYYAKNVACLDFASISTHDHFINGLVSPIGWSANWEHTKLIVDDWNKKDNFATIQAYEWRGYFPSTTISTGDRVIYSRNSEIPFYSGADKHYKNENLLNAALKEWMEEEEGRKLMTITHHPPHTLMGMKADWSTYDPEISRLVEIYSVHGSSEMTVEQGNEAPIYGGNKAPTIMETDDPGYHIRDALSMGYHIGFMASGDSHDGHIGHSISHTEARHLWQAPLSYTAYANHMYRCNHWQQNGLIGVFASDLERSEIFDAMWDRACYAIKGTSRPYINFTINGTTIGQSDSILKVENNNVNRLIKVDIAAGGGDKNYINKIEIIRNNDVWKTIELKGERKRIYHGSWLDTDPIEGISYWDYTGEDPETHEENGKYYITDDAINGVKNPEDLSTNGEMFYYIKVFTSSSRYYDDIFDYYNRELVPRGEDLAWVGPIWIKPE